VYSQYSEKSQGKLCFSGQVQVLKNAERWKNYVFSVYSLGGGPCKLG